MVGYCTNDYRLWSPEYNRVILGKDIVFDEGQFLFQETSDEFFIQYGKNILRDVDQESEDSVYGDGVYITKEDTSVHTEDVQAEIVKEVSDDRIVDTTRRSTSVKTKPDWFSNYTDLTMKRVKLPGYRYSKL